MDASGASISPSPFPSQPDASSYIINVSAGDFLAALEGYNIQIERLTKIAEALNDSIP